MRLHIIRHGDPDYENDALTPLGHREAEALAERMACLPIEAIYASPMGRAQETAGYTARKLGLSVNTLPWTRELSLPGGIPDTDMLPTPVAIWNLPAHQLKACETYKDGWMNAPVMSPPAAKEKFTGIRRGWEELMARYDMSYQDGLIYAEDVLPKQDIALFCHHGLGLSLLSIIMDIPATVLWRSVWLAPTSVTTLLFEEMDRMQINLRIISLGDTSHLYKADMADRNFSGLTYNVR